MSLRKYPSGSEKRKRKKLIDDFVETQRGALDRFLMINPCDLTNPNNELVIVLMEEEEPTIGISKEEENIEININDNDVSGPENPTNSSAPSVDEPSS
jgi:hypothetical protein